ncbi:hypothetical protein HII13_000096 [Brettanomyces bruxellensis]|uniref:tRNA (guanine(9)-N1)-methyltransferase n=1 Tax=Dekkera bruxellensis TaxID=5007 RepID=A0A7D9D0C7_DEKBR|nr:hypothetical protein HII13_000096 [Brettanomyces bruxellensis]VUG19070.1 TRM10 [Brettanomyces bruxellensis]
MTETINATNLVNVSAKKEQAGADHTQSSESVEKEAENGNKKKVYPRKPKPIIPEGMSKHQWKKMMKRKRWEENKVQMRVARRQRLKERKQERKRKIQELKDKGEDYSSLLPAKKPKKLTVDEQKDTNVSIIVDCAFDDLMLEKEVVSLSGQIARSYSVNKRSPNRVKLVIGCFNKRLKSRFDESLKDYFKWDHNEIEFTENDLDKLFVGKDLSKVTYLSADTDEKIEELKSGETYIVGGIVDKGRHKNLCKEKAEKLGIKTRRLPIDECIKISGRKVLTTAHVVELLIRWFEYKDWTKTFEQVLPARKLKDNKPRNKEAKD